MIAQQAAAKHHMVKLSRKIRDRLNTLIQPGEHRAERLAEARISLQADASTPAKDGVTARSPPPST